MELVVCFWRAGSESLWMKKLPEFVCRPGVGVAAKLGRIETLDRECQE